MRVPSPIWFGIVGLLAGVGLVLAPSARALHGLWTDTDARAYTHGYLILGICVWLLWRNAARIASEPAAPLPRLAPVLLGAALAWTVAWRAGLQDIHLLLLPIIAWLAVCMAWGWRVARQCALPIGFLLFALPLWSSINTLLQDLTTLVITFIIWVTGLTAYVSGNFVRVPGGVFEIQGGCSGLHFFVVGLALAALYGEVARDPLRERVRWLVIMGALSLLANWVRVYTIIIAGYLTNMQHYLVRVDHYTFGWVVFMFALLLFFWIGSRRPAPAGSEPAPRTEASTSGLPDARVLAMGCTALVSVAALPALSQALAWRNAGSPAPTLNWPAAQARWHGPLEGAASSWNPYYPGASATGLKTYREGASESDGASAGTAASVELFQAAYREQRQGAELVGSQSLLWAEPGGESVMDEQTVMIRSGKWREMRISQRDGTQALIRARWRVGAHDFATPIFSQLWYGVTALFVPVQSSVIALRAQCRTDCDGARAALDSFDATLGMGTTT